MLFCVFGIVTGNETGSPYDVLGDPLALRWTTISSLNCYHSIPLTKALLSVIIKVLIVCSNSHKDMVLHATPSPRDRETVTGFLFTTEEFL